MTPTREARWPTRPSPPSLWSAVCTSMYDTKKGCRGLPAGGLGVSPNLPLLPNQGVQGSPCRGFGGVPQSTLSPPQSRGAGVSLPGVWGCPPIFPFPILYLQPFQKALVLEVGRG